MTETEPVVNQTSKNLLEKSVERSTGETIEFLRETPSDELRRILERRKGTQKGFPSYWPLIGRRPIQTRSREEVDKILNKTIMANPENIIASFRKFVERKIKHTKPTEYAKLETAIHDQGGGWSYCNSCRTNIDLEKLKMMHCPNPKCNKPLIWGETHLNSGGSDF
jgi:hypothetical protein